MEIYKIIERLKIAEYDYNTAREKLRNKEDSLHLHTDWNGLKQEGITNQRQREARIREITRTEREKLQNMEIERDHLKRLYYAMLNEPKKMDLPGEVEIDSKNYIKS